MTKETTASERFMLAEMTRNLREGDLGEHFGTFMFSNPALGAHVINDALGKYQANRTYWPNMGAFALNYLTTVLRVMDASVPYAMDKSSMTDIQRKAYEDIWHESVWTQWAEYCASFAIGS